MHAAGVSLTAHAKSEETDELTKILEVNTSMVMHLEKLEASQARMEEYERLRGAVKSQMFSSMLGVDFAERFHGGARKLADLHDQPARRAPPRDDGPRTRESLAPRQQPDLLPEPPASIPPYHPLSPPQVIPAVTGHTLA